MIIMTMLTICCEDSYHQPFNNNVSKVRYQLFRHHTNVYPHVKRHMCHDSDNMRHGEYRDNARGSCQENIYF